MYPIELARHASPRCQSAWLFQGKPVKNPKQNPLDQLFDFHSSFEAHSSPGYLIPYSNYLSIQWYLSSSGIPSFWIKFAIQVSWSLQVYSWSSDSEISCWYQIEFDKSSTHLTLGHMVLARVVIIRISIKKVIIFYPNLTNIKCLYSRSANFGALIVLWMKNSQIVLWYCILLT